MNYVYWEHEHNTVWKNCDRINAILKSLLSCWILTATGQSPKYKKHISLYLNLMESWWKAPQSHWTSILYKTAKANVNGITSEYCKYVHLFA